MESDFRREVSRAGGLASTLFLVQIIAVSLGAWGQTPETKTREPEDTQPAPASFDVASIRESDPSTPSHQRRLNPAGSGRYLVQDFFPIQVIGDAYGVNWRFQVLGGPDWVSTARLNIDARSDGDTDSRLSKMPLEQAVEEKQHMLQALLAERLRLRVHSETKNVPAYILRVAADKPLRLTKPDVVPARPGVTSAPGAEGMELDGHGASMTQLAERLSFYLKTIVTDETGLAGSYNFTLQYSGNSMEINDVSERWPPIEAAVQRLGLRLVATPVPTQMIVIDHIERATAN